MGWETLRSYGGQALKTRVSTPRSLEALQEELAAATQHGWKVVFRAGGRSFDTHSMNDTLVIFVNHLPDFQACHVDTDAKTMRVGAGARWGDILAETMRHGLIPPIMVTSSGATAGGTLSADCLSRFSPSLGKEGRHVRSFELLKLDGTRITCSRTQHADVFKGVISGLGCLGLVLEITYELLSLPDGEDSVVKTMVVPFEGLRGLADRLVSGARSIDRTRKRVAGRPEATFTGPSAISAAVYMNDKRQGIVMRSQYEAGQALKPTVLHQPTSVVHLALQILSLFKTTRKIGWWLTMKFVYNRRRTYVDRIPGYTFFQDGNERVKHAGRKLGLPMGVRQQTYVLPWDPADLEGSRTRLRSFLKQADDLLDEQKMLPALIDVLYVPDESAEGFYLSSSTGGAGFAVSIAFENALSGSFAKQEAALLDIAGYCHALGGRVHPVKHVFAEARDMEASYPGLEQMVRLKNTLDPQKVLRSDFLARVFPKLA